MARSAAPPPVTDAPDAAVRNDLIAQLHASALVPLINIVVAAISVVVLWPIYPAQVALTWLLAVAVTATGRVYLIGRFQRRRQTVVPVERWARAYSLGACVSGILWGLLASALFVSPDPVFPIFVAFVVGGMVAASAVRDSPVLSAFYCFSAPAAVPLIAALLVQGRPIPVAMGLLLATFSATLTIVAREQARRSADDSRMKIELRDLNTVLAGKSSDLAREFADKSLLVASLEESQARLQAVTDNALDGIVIAGPEGEIVFWNPAAERIFGFTSAEILGRQIHAILTPERFRPLATDRYRHFMATGEGAVLGKTVALSGLRKDGTEFPVDLSITEMMLGGSRHALGIARDTSERTEAESAIRDREAELLAGQRLSHVGGWTFNPQTRRVEWSDEARRILGLGPADAGTDVAELSSVVSPDGISTIISVAQVCLERGEDFEIDLPFSPIGGEPGWISMRGERVGDPGKFLLKGTLQDISIRKKAETAILDEEAMFRSVVEQNLSGIFIIAENGTLVYVNPRALLIVGLSNIDAAIGAPAISFVAESDRAAVEGVLGSLFGGDETFAELSFAISRADGGAVDVLAQGSLAIFRGKRVILAVMMDISERKRAEREISELNAKMSAAMVVLRRHEQEQAAIAKLSDMLQSCRTTSEAYPILAAAAANLFPESRGGLARSEPGSREFTRATEWGEEMLAPSFQAEDCWALRAGQRHEGQGPAGPAECHHFIHAPDGPYVCMPLTVMGVTRGLLTLAVAKDRPIDDDLRQLMQSFGDVVKLSLANLNLRDSLSEQAIRDPLTGLFNRRYLDETLPRELRRAQRNGAPLTVALLDIDLFKNFNDEHGHDAGDAVLREIGARLKAALRADDIACRYGGEEFVLVLPDCSIEDAPDRLRQVCADVKGSTIEFHGADLPPVTLSVGLAARGLALATGEALITAADQAMYLAKQRGRDRIETYEPTPAGIGERRAKAGHSRPPTRRSAA